MSVWGVSRWVDSISSDLKKKKVDSSGDPSLSVDGRASQVHLTLRVLIFLWQPGTPTWNLQFLALFDVSDVRTIARLVSAPTILAVLLF